ncbi:MAG: phage tail assembly chaperone G [Lachnospiraceae bacterium]
MGKVTLTLTDDKGKAITYTNNKVTGYDLLTTFNHQDEIIKLKTNAEVVRARVEYTANLFESPEVTSEAILKGLGNEEIIPVLDGIISSVLGTDKEDAETGEE